LKSMPETRKLLAGMKRIHARIAEEEGTDTERRGLIEKYDSLYRQYNRWESAVKKGSSPEFRKFLAKEGRRFLPENDREIRRKYGIASASNLRAVYRAVRRISYDKLKVNRSYRRLHVTLTNFNAL